MPQRRVGVGIALLLAFAGAATAQPTRSNSRALRPTSAGSALPSPLLPDITPEKPPAPVQPQPDRLPGLDTPAPSPTSSPPSNSNPIDDIQTLAAQGDQYPPLKELPTELPNIIPPPAYGGHGENHEIPAFMTPFVPAHRGWYTGGEFLLMRARNTDMDYVIQSTNNNLGTIGPIESLKYGIGTGLRAEVGYRYGEGKWETGFGYTYFTDGGNGNIAAGSGQILLPTLTRPGLTDRATSASANVDLDYQLFDMIIARRMPVDENFAIRWIGGFRFADIRQTFNAFYDGADARGAQVNTRSQFQGFGPIFGAEAVLAGWRGFHLYTRATAGLISGRSLNRVYETNDSGQTTYVNSSYDVRKIVPTGSIAIGGGWQYRTISIRAGYQITTWQGIFQRPHFVDDVSQGKLVAQSSNLTLEGLFIQLGLSF